MIRPMRVLVVHAHPCVDSFGGRLRDTVVDTLSRVGHTVDLLDLYGEGFDPTLPSQEWSNHRLGIDALPAVADHARRLRQARALIFVYPTWWGGQPAILKGWLDRVWVEGVAYSLPPGSRRIRGRLRNVRRLVVVTTHGSTKLVNAVQGEPGKRTILRGLRPLVHPLARRSWIGLYGLDRDDPAAREAFVARVAAAMARL